MRKSGFLAGICVLLVPFAAFAQVKVFLPTNNNNSPLSAPSVEEDDAPVQFNRSELVEPRTQARPSALPAARGSSKSSDDDSGGMSKKEFMQPMEDTFNLLDVNRDGFLSIEEIEKSN